MFAQISQTFFISLFQTSLEGTQLPEGTSISVLVIFFLQRLSITIQKREEMQASSILSQTGTLGLAHSLSTLPLLNTPPIPTIHLLQANSQWSKVTHYHFLAYEICITDSNSTWVLSLFVYFYILW